MSKGAAGAGAGAVESVAGAAAVASASKDLDKTVACCGKMYIVNRLEWQKALGSFVRWLRQLQQVSEAPACATPINSGSYLQLANPGTHAFPNKAWYPRRIPVTAASAR